MQISLNDFQVGNWVVYLPEGNYCIIKSLSPDLILEGVLENYLTQIECVDKIKITEYKLQVLGFTVQYPRFIKKYNNEIQVLLRPISLGVYTLYKNEEEFSNVKYIHQVQNDYYNITGEKLIGNLYGVRER